MPRPRRGFGYAPLHDPAAAGLLVARHPFQVSFDCLNRKLRYNLCFQWRLHAGRTHSSTESLWSLVRITRYCLLASPWLDRRLARGKDRAWPRLRLHHGHRSRSDRILPRRLGFYEARDLGRRFSLFSCGRDARRRHSRFHRPPLRQLEPLSRHIPPRLEKRSRSLAATIFECCGSLPSFSPVTGTSPAPTLSGSRVTSCDTILVCIPELTSH